MNFSDMVTVGASRSRVWQVLSDAQAIGPCVPGLQEVEVYDDGLSFGGKAQIKVGSSTLSFPAHVAWIEQDAPNAGSLRATAALAGYEIEGHGTITLSEDEEGRTTLAWEANVVIPEKLAANALMVQMARLFATRFFQGFFQCVQSRLESV